jgi:hypothetical protein
VQPCEDEPRRTCKQGRRCFRHPDLGCRQVRRRWWQRKRGAGGFGAESRVTAVTRNAALRAGGRSCLPASPTEGGSLGHAPRHGLTSRHAAHEFLQRDPGIRGPARSRDHRGLLLQGGPRERLPADGLAMDDLSRSREQPENSIRLLADASVSRWDKSRTPHSRAEELAQRFKNCTLTFRASEIS